MPTANPSRFEQMYTRYFDTVVETRTCGDCIACCQILNIDEPALKKPAGQICPNHNGVGCSIYQNRPQTCRDWFCLWRRDDGLPETANPAKCGVAFSVERTQNPPNMFEHLFIVGRALNGPEDFEHPDTLTSVKHFINEGTLPVWLAFGGSKRLIYPHPELAALIQQPNQIADWKTRTEVENLRAHFLRATPDG